jgi:hypothetical protein
MERTSNPLKIIDNPEINAKHGLPEAFIILYQNDLILYFENMKIFDKNLTIVDFLNLAIYYSIDLLIEYKNKSSNTLPQSVINDVTNHVLKATQNIFPSFMTPDAVFYYKNKLKLRIWQDNIIEETEAYMNNIQL